MVRCDGIITATAIKNKYIQRDEIACNSSGSTILLANGVRMENIAKILGHKDIWMTQHYAQVNDKNILADMAAVERRMTGCMPR